MCSVSDCYWHVMPKFANLANEKIIGLVVGFVMNETSDSMNDEDEFVFLPKI